MLTCPHLSTHANIAHGFFTREGGHSFGLYASLNCGYGSGDDIEIVAKNRDTVAKALGLSEKELCTAYQIHSPTAVILDAPWHWQDAPEADALVTNTPGIALGILTADCMPILFSDAAHGVIGAAHAGWKGALGGVIEATIDAMCTLGASPKTISATIGPAIAQASYEVSQEFVDRFLAQSPDHAQYFSASKRHGHHLFDLPAYGLSRMKSAGIGQINLLAHDTCLNENRFFSYRRTCLRGESVYGRQISAIMLEK